MFLVVKSSIYNDASYLQVFTNLKIMFNKMITIEIICSSFVMFFEGAIAWSSDVIWIKVRWQQDMSEFLHCHLHYYLLCCFLFVPCLIHQVLMLRWCLQDVRLDIEIIRHLSRTDATFDADALVICFVTSSRSVDCIVCCKVVVISGYVLNCLVQYLDADELLMSGSS